MEVNFEFTFKDDAEMSFFAPFWFYKFGSELEQSQLLRAFTKNFEASTGQRVLPLYCIEPDLKWLQGIPMSINVA